jgi:formamidopyrimidine-DNA glycosylase
LLLKGPHLIKRRIKKQLREIPMPELPEVETICRGLEPELEGRRILGVTLRRKDLRIPFPPQFEEKVERRRILSLERRAKYLLFHLEGGLAIIFHLGMSGRMLIRRQKPMPGRHDHVILELSDKRWLVFNDARRFGLMTLASEDELPRHPFFTHLGAEPLSGAFTGASLKAALAGKKAPIKTTLMDQRVVVGVGNIYASEALYKAGIAPRKAAGSLNAAQADALARAVKEVLESAIRSGGSTLRDYVRSTGDAGYFQHSFQVYGREEAPCFACGNPIKRIVQQGRSTFYCAHCQKK